MEAADKLRIKIVAVSGLPSRVLPVGIITTSPYINKAETIEMKGGAMVSPLDIFTAGLGL